VTYRIGYKKPPRETRFKPGESGNPGGKPKASKNRTTLLLTELDTKVAISEGGATDEGHETRLDYQKGGQCGRTWRLQSLSGACEAARTNWDEPVDADPNAEKKLLTSGGPDKIVDPGALGPLYEACEKKRGR
jgi:Family of unknown function (DUF5681)